MFFFQIGPETPQTCSLELLVCVPPCYYSLLHSLIFRSFLFLSHYRTTSEFGEPCEGGDRVSALPENLNKPSEKVSKRTGR